MRLRAKRDTSEPAIVEALTAAGWTVQPLSLPHGPDLLLGRAGITELAECKTGRRKVRPNQQAWHDAWRGRPVIVLRSVEEAVAWVQRDGNDHDQARGQTTEICAGPRTASQRELACRGSGS